MKKDIEIAQEAIKLNINKIAEKIELTEDDIEYYGKYKAKIVSKKTKKSKGKLILVTAINPTPYGEGKTTISIGLGDALNKINRKTLIVLREPSLGPVFGIKGGATGGGYSQVVPMEDINLHFTGDIHAITSANNLLSAAIDNHIKQGNNLKIIKIIFNRCLDVNDRALREVEIGLGGNVNGTPRKDNFNITAASEIMTILCLSKDIQDLEHKIDNIIIGYNDSYKPIYCKDLKISGAMTVLLKDAINPNLVQTLENNPVIIHGGPFANIAHGCNSIIATKLAMNIADYVVTEAGFGADLGALKFMDIKCRYADIKPAAVVLVATIKALKYNGESSKENILNEDINALQKGLSNLEAHINNLHKFGVNIVVTLNKYNTDTVEEINFLKKYCQLKNIDFTVSDAYTKGSDGSIDLANKVIEATNKTTNFKYLYNVNESIKSKIEIICNNIYNTNRIEYTEKAINSINNIEKNNLDKLPICISKTQYSISDDPKKLGNPKDYIMHVKDVKLYNGAGFITILMGEVMTMPGLPKTPSYENIKLKDNKIEGIF